MNDCVFCRIAAHQAPAQVLFEDEQVMAFYDIAPRAPVHLLVIPKEHIRSLAEASAEHQDLLGKLLLSVQRAAREAGIAAAFRVVTNSGEGAGQSVFHLHFHVLGGRRMGWPPG